MNKLNKMNYSILLMNWAYEVEISNVDYYVSKFILVKRFLYLLFQVRCKMIWVNYLFADENCQKECKSDKMWRKMSKAAIFVVMRAVTLN